MATTFALPPRAAAVAPARRGLRRLGWGDWLGLAAVALPLLIELFILTVGVDDLDEGYFAEQATRVLRSEVPYRDFDSFYTPGLLYLHAFAFWLLHGSYIVGLRVVALLGRAALAFAMYGIGRTVTRPAYAVIAPLVLLVGLDTSPVGWEPHPGWPSTATAAALVLLLAYLPRVQGRRRDLLLGGAGALVALTFLFKQNAGAYMGVAAAGLVFLHGARPGQAVSRTLRAVQAVGVLSILFGLYWLMRPFGESLVFTYLLAPPAVLGALFLLGPVRRDGVGLPQTLRLLAPLMAGFLLVTLAWFGPLLIALGGQVGRLASFVGAVNQSVLYAPLDMPDQRGWIVPGLAFVIVAAIGSRGWSRWTVLVTGVGAALFAMVSMSWVSDAYEISNFLQTPGRASQGLLTMLPPFAAWAGLWMVRRPAVTLRAWRLRWYMLAGSFLLLTQYPRLDTIHLAWSCPILLVIGGVALGRMHRKLTRRWRLGRGERLALYGALILVPALSASSMLYLRVSLFAEEDPATGWPRRIILARIETLPSMARFLAPRQTRDDLQQEVGFLQAATAPGEPIFVYPTSPLIYVVADRPNPTRFAHLYPGAATPAELQQVIDTLEARQVRIVAINDFWLDIWKTLGDENAPLEAYFASHFRLVYQVGSMRFLERIEPVASSQLNQS